MSQEGLKSIMSLAIAIRRCERGRLSVLVFKSGGVQRYQVQVKAERRQNFLPRAELTSPLGSRVFLSSINDAPNEYAKLLGYHGFDDKERDDHFRETAAADAPES